jgi:hypothetical protein
LFQETPLSGFPPEAFLPVELFVPTANSRGPFFQMPVHVSDVQVATIGVAGYATNIFFDEEGDLRYKGMLGGNEFEMTGVFHTASVPEPLSPERAVILVAEAFGIMANLPPRFIRLGGRASPFFGMFEVHFEPSIDVELFSTGDVWETEVLYVSTRNGSGDADGGRGFGIRFFVPDLIQPKKSRVFWVVDLQTFEHRAVDWPNRDDIPSTMRLVRIPQ